MTNEQSGLARNCTTAAISSGLPVRFIDMNDQVCGAGSARCETERGGMVLYTDDDHLTATFSRSLGPVLGERLEAALQR